MLLPGQPLTHRACNQVDQWRTCPTMFHPPIHPLNKQLFVLSVRWWWSVRLVLVLATNNGHVPSSQSVSMCSIRRACCFCAALPSHQFVVKWVFRRTVSFVRLRNAMPSLPVGNGLIGNASGEHAKCASGRSLADCYPSRPFIVDSYYPGTSYSPLITTRGASNTWPASQSVSARHPF